MPRATMLLGLVAAAVPETASAQFFGPGPGMPPGIVRRIVNSQGFRLIAPPYRTGEVYVVDVVDDRSGVQKRLIVDAYEGTILQVFFVPGTERTPPARTRVAADNLPFPGGSLYPDDPPPRRRASRPRQHDSDGGLFGLFSPPPPEPGPIVVPAAPAPKRPHHVIRPKPRAIARATPQPESVSKLAPPARAPAQAAPSMPVATPPTAPVAKTPAAAAPAPVAKKEIAPTVPAKAAAAPPPAAKPTPKPERAAAAPPAAKPAPPKVSEAKRKAGPLNDIPPAPLE